ncbi:hypothetical protein [Bhargavaea cecembensis]|uniref:hypothetical protein n=1 Tax=Bhargavaea cecembensis TaxID=394098 RepID=UPI0006950831|nr:hypothetical protein [Bhargavaea cecembensis]
MRKWKWAASASLALLLAGCNTGGSGETSDGTDPADTDDVTAAPAEENAPETEPSEDTITDEATEQTGSEDTDAEEADPAGEDGSDESKDAAEETSSLFPPEGAELHFKGEGNEFAELDISVRLSDGEYVVLDEDNGGVTLRKAYRISEDKIEQVLGKPLEEDEPLPSKEELVAMEPMNTYLALPAEKGAEFEGWTVLGNDETVETPFRTFDGAILIEEKTADFTNRSWIVPGFGEVKRESVMEEEGEEPFIVTSILESATGI